jgi:hypothetical protein
MSMVLLLSECKIRDNYAEHRFLYIRLPCENRQANFSYFGNLNRRQGDS